MAVVAAKDPTLVAVAEGDFAKQRATIEKQLADGKTYVEISGGDLTRVRQALERMGGVMEGVASVDDLDPDRRVALFNDQEVVNTILTQAAADSRLICERTRPTGSRMPVSSCQTVAERNRRQENDQGELDKLQRAVMPLRE
jgi:hypothetical protein